MTTESVSEWPVRLNVYDVVTEEDPALVPRLNDWFGIVGVGVFHTGVEVHSTEYAFGGHVEATSGIFEVEPRVCPGVRFRSSILLGRTALSPAQTTAIIRRLGAADFLGTSYSLISHNCNHFSAALCAELGVAKRFPSYVNRLAVIAAGVSCLLPEGVDQPIGESVPTAVPRVEEPRKPPPVATI